MNGAESRIYTKSDGHEPSVKLVFDIKDIKIFHSQLEVLTLSSLPVKVCSLLIAHVLVSAQAVYNNEINNAPPNDGDEVLKLVLFAL